MKAYAIKDPDDKLILATIQVDENHSKSALSRWIGWGCWRNYSQEGYCCVPVEITETKEMSSGTFKIAPPGATKCVITIERELISSQEELISLYQRNRTLRPSDDDYDKKSQLESRITELRKQLGI